VSRARQASQTLLYLLIALPLGAAAAAVLIAGWVLCTCLAITPLIVPALIGFRAAVGVLTRADAEVARVLLGTSVRPPLLSPGPRSGYWRRGLNVLRDEAFWLQQLYLLQRFVLGFAMALVVLSLLGAGLFGIVQPIDYRWTHPGFGTWHVDSLARSLLFVPAGVLAVVLALVLIGSFGALARSLVLALLRTVRAPAAPYVAHTRVMRLRWLALHVAIFVGLSGITTAIWALTTRAYFWPAWVMLVFALPLAIHGWVELVELRPALASRQRFTRGLALHEGIAAAFAAFLTCIWALTNHGYFWPVWPIIVLVLAFGAHAAVVLGPALRQGTLAERIASLETSRAGAVDQQDAELRRIERDLHDGAQARLVALGMSLGMAEQKLASDPAAARELLADARRGAHEALEELRDLARGIHPPVLADRGLEAAIAALTSRTPLHVRLTVDVEKRPAPPVESAAYFVVAEALANTGKHAHAEHVDIAVRRRRASMFVEIVDDGVGGADRSGSGLSGLVRRVEALDGTLEISSPPGGPTTVRAVMPCGS
jgi:signal transduction histidine kinase